MVHVPAKFRENTSMRFWVTVQKLSVSDRQTDRWGALQYLPSRAAGDNIVLLYCPNIFMNIFMNIFRNILMNDLNIVLKYRWIIIVNV